MTWSVIAYRANADARRAAVGDATVRVIHGGGMRRFEPVHAPRDPAFVFFPGALVDSRAYAPPGDSAPVVLGGHSRGAVVAVGAAAGNVRGLAGLVLVGTSHPRDVDLSGLRVPVTKIVGTRDGLATPAEVQQNASLLPPHTRWLWVPGGNHSQFGWYGFQPMDRWPEVPAAQQRAT